MPNNHLITKDYLNLAGLSTDSIYQRIPSVAEKAQNIYRYPDGTLSPRRGYQAKLAAKGGYGSSTYKNPLSSVLETVVVNRDGVLYKQLENTLTISYVPITPRQIEFSIITDERYVSSIPPGGFTQIGSITAFMVGPSAAVVDGLQEAVTTIDVFTGHTVQNGDVIQFYDYVSQALVKKTVTGTAATTITFSGAVNVLNQTPIDVIFMDQPFGKGFDDSLIFTIANFVTAINAVTDFTATLSAGADSSVPAAFLDLVEPVNITTTSPIVSEYKSWILIPATFTPQFPGTYANANSSDLENVTFANFDGVLYAANGYDLPLKYDGQSLYLSGMPVGNQPQVGTSVAGGLTGSYRYAITYEFTDALGHVVEGALSPVSAPDVVVANQQISVTVKDLVQGSGYNTDGAIKNGTQTGVNTLNVNAGHTFIAGDTAYFLESPTATVNGPQVNVNIVTVNAGHLAFVGEDLYFTDSSNVGHSRMVLSTSATTIQISGLPVTFAGGEVFSTYRTRKIATVSPTTIALQNPVNPIEPIMTNVLGGSPISNNLKINIYRNQNTGTQLNLVASIPNNSFSTYQTYIDNLSDLDLAGNAAFPVQDRIPGPPPKSKYIFAYRNQLTYAGVPAGQTGGIDPDSVYYSEGNQPENVPPATNFLTVPSNDDVVSGLAESGNTLIVGKDRSFYSIEGDLLTGQFVVNPIAPGNNIGCAAHAAMKSVGELLYILHTSGVYTIAKNVFLPVDRNGAPVPISKPINLLFNETPYQPQYRFVFKRATAINYTKDKQYILFLPCEDTQTSVRDANLNSQTLVFDYENRDWYQWDNINAAGGFYSINDDLYWQERRLSTFVGNTSNTYKQHRRYRIIDQADHTQPIQVAWTSSWEDVGYPRVRKKFIRAILLFDRILPLFQSNEPTFNFFSCIDRVPGLQHTLATISLTPENGSSQWSLTPWSWSQWSAYSDSFFTVPLRQGTQAKAMQIGFTMFLLNTSFRFQGFQLEIAPDFRKTVVR